ncbi:MAG: hypothetical protein Q7J80_16405 [Anaerolineales bacterium]|nr:hypothetical protein [Anaerolineales bacterium]
MKPKRIHHNTSPDPKTAADELMKAMFEHGKAQFGSAVKSFWFYDGDLCPACFQREIGLVKFKGKDALAINAFIYRERGVLIGYLLCGTCAEYIHAEAKKNPYKQTPMHADIETNLIAAYHKHLMSLNA